MFKTYFLFTLLSFFTQICYAQNKLKSYGILDEEVYQELKSFLAKADVHQSVKDTIIIKYDYNSKNCWKILDNKEDHYIKKIIEDSQNRLKSAKSVRPNTSIYRFVKPGDNKNKLIIWDNTIIIDKHEDLYDLIFSKVNDCGNSILILPNKQYFFKKNDPHFDLLNWKN